MKKMKMMMRVGVFCRGRKEFDTMQKQSRQHILMGSATAISRVIMHHRVPHLPACHTRAIPRHLHHLPHLSQCHPPTRLLLPHPHSHPSEHSVVTSISAHMYLPHMRRQPSRSAVDAVESQRSITTDVVYTRCLHTRRRERKWQKPSDVRAWRTKGHHVKRRDLFTVGSAPIPTNSPEVTTTTTDLCNKTCEALSFLFFIIWCHASKSLWKRELAVCRITP